MSSRTLRRGVLVTVIAGLLAAHGIGLDARAQAAAQAAPAVVARFARDPNPIALRGPARPERYMEASGRKAALLGREDGSFEAWVYPLKVLHDFRLSFGTPDYADPIPGVNLAAAVDVRPEASAVRYAHAAFTVDAVWLVPLNDQGAIILLDVTTSQPLQVVVKFRPDLKPMWPAALGGQYSYWDAGQKAYVLGEASGKHSAMIGSPFGIDPPEQPAHNLPDAPSQFTIAITPETAARGLVPIVIAASLEGLERREGDLPATAHLERGHVPRVGGALPAAARGDDEHRQPRRPPRPRLRVGQGGARQGVRLQPAPRVRAHRGPRAVGHERAAGVRLVLRRRRLHQLVGHDGVRRLRHGEAVARVPARAPARRRQDDARAVAGRGLHQVVRGVSVRLLPRRHDAALHRRGARLRARERRRGDGEGLLAVDEEGVRLLRVDRRGRRRPDGQHEGGPGGRGNRHAAAARRPDGRLPRGRVDGGRRGRGGAGGPGGRPVRGDGEDGGGEGARVVERPLPRRRRAAASTSPT